MPDAPPNLLMMVQTFMKIGGQTTDRFNPQQTTLYIGLCLEELGEMLACIAVGELTPSDASRMSGAALFCQELAKEFKAGNHMGAITRADREELLDGFVDLAWVGLGGATSLSCDAGGAVAEVARANLDKYPGGVATRDANGKIQKPASWRGPNLQPFVQYPEERFYK